MVAGGIEHDVRVSLVTWKRDPIYKRSDLPLLSRCFNRPLPLNSTKESDDDLFPMSRQVLMEICWDRDPETLPLPVRAALAGAKSMGPYMKHHERMDIDDQVVRISVSVPEP